MELAGGGPFFGLTVGGPRPAQIVPRGGGRLATLARREGVLRVVNLRTIFEVEVFKVLGEGSIFSW